MVKLYLSILPNPGRLLAFYALAVRIHLGGVDVCVVFITSRIATSVPPDGLLIDDTHPDFSKTGLKTASPIRAGKIATLDRRVVLGALGRLTPALLRALNQKLKFALGL